MKDSDLKACKTLEMLRDVALTRFQAIPFPDPMADKERDPELFRLQRELREALEVIDAPARDKLQFLTELSKDSIHDRVILDVRTVMARKYLDDILDQGFGLAQASDCKNLLKRARREVRLGTVFVKSVNPFLQELEGAAAGLGLSAGQKTKIYNTLLQTAVLVEDPALTQKFKQSVRLTIGTHGALSYAIRDTQRHYNMPNACPDKARIKRGGWGDGDILKVPSFPPRKSKANTSSDLSVGSEAALTPAYQ